jgi:SAM-dependent methyltransferase
MSDFYDLIAPFYHLIWQKEWNEVIAEQAAFLEGLIRGEWGEDVRRVLDVSCGTGTQSLALATAGFDVTASDLSAGSVAVAREEAARRGLDVGFTVGDMRRCYELHGGGFDLLLCAGNALPHLLDDGEIRLALRQFYRCLRPGGGLLIIMRQYDYEERGRNLLKPFGVREEGGRRFIIFQVWDFDGPDHYDFGMYFVDEDLANGAVTVHVGRSRYYAVSPDRVVALATEAGFANARRLDDGESHPAPAIVAGTRPT